MLYTGGILEGANIVEAFANCDSSTALVLGSFFTLLFTFVLYIPRKVLSFGQFCEAFTEGFKAMVPAILILTLAWTLSGVCREAVSYTHLDVYKRQQCTFPANSL